MINYLVKKTLNLQKRNAKHGIESPEKGKRSYKVKKIQKVSKMVNKINMAQERQGSTKKYSVIV